MANWKKVIVSGSAAELLQVTASTADITTLNVTAGSGSFSGSFQGDGSGLTGVPATGIVLSVLSQSLGIENFSYNGQASAEIQLATGSTHFTDGVRSKLSAADTTGASGIELHYNSSTGEFSGSLVESNFTLGATQVDLGSTATTLDGLTLTNVEATGAFSGTFTGTTDLPDLTESTGITAFTYDGASTATIAVSGASALSSNAVTKWSGDAFVDSSLTDNGSVVSGASSIQLTGASSNLSGSFSGSFAGDGSNLTGVPATGIVLSTLSDGNGIVDFSYNGQSTASVTVEASGSTITVTSAGIAVATSGITTNELLNGAVTSAKLDTDITIAGDLIVSNDLTVLGTASFQNTVNLDVADRFILLASGSNTAGDGGIVIQQGTQGIGEAFAFDSAVDRWGVTGSFDGSTSTIVPDAFMAAVVVGSGTDPDAAPARYDAAGNIFVGTDENIWIYS